MARPVIQLENVSWTYSGASSPALSRISAQIAEGEFIAVMGGGGSGKSSFCMILNGLIPHSLAGRFSGEARIDGVCTREMSVARLSEKVGMAFDDPEAQFFTTRAFDEVAFALENMEMPKEEIRERAHWALRAAGLEACAMRAPWELSGGQRQRLAIAAALAMAGRVLALDDPCARLDPEGARETLSFIGRLREKRALTVVMATSRAQDAVDFADRVFVLINGRLAATGAPREIFSDSALLMEAGIDPPEICDFAARMSRLGTPLPHFPLTVREAAQGLAQIMPASCFPPPGGVDFVIEKYPPRGGSAITARALTYSYKSLRSRARLALDGMNFEMRDGEFVAIFGQNGCGKTTLFKTLSGLLKPESGEIFLRGKRQLDMSLAEISAEVGYVMQDSDSQLFERTVLDEAAFALRLRGIKPAEARERALAALDTLGIAGLRDEFPPALRRADRTKVVFAAILAMGARALILDEPLVGQDSQGAGATLEALASLRRAGCAVALIAHDVGAAARSAQRIVVMKVGRAHMEGSPRELFEREDELAGAGILLPPICRLSLAVKDFLPSPEIALSAEELSLRLAQGLAAFGI